MSCTQCVHALVHVHMYTCTCTCVQALLCHQNTEGLYGVYLSEEQVKLNTGFQVNHRILFAPLLLSHPAKRYWKKMGGLPCRRLFHLYFHRPNVIIPSLFSLHWRDKGDSGRDRREKHGEKTSLGFS